MRRTRLLPILALATSAGCQREGSICGPRTHEQGGICVADDPGGGVRTVVQTHTETNTVTDGDLDPGRFQAPLVQLVKVLDDHGALGTHGALEDHMHVDEVRYRPDDGKLFYCAYTFGVIDASAPHEAEYLAQGFEWDLGSPVGRATGCLHLDWDDADPDIVYVSHRGNYDFQPHLSVVDLGSYVPDPEAPDEIALAPVLAPPLREPGASYEGLDAENGYVYVALHAGGIGVFERDPATNELSRVGGDDTLVANAYDIEVVGTLAYVLDESAGLVILDVADPNAITEVSRLFLGGVDRDLRVEGGYAYVAGGGAGLVIADVSDPASPAIVSYTPTPGTATRVGYHGDRVAVAAWNDTRVYDVSDRSAPAFIGAARLETSKSYAGDEDRERPDITARTLGVDLYGDHLFIGNWWTPYTFSIHAERTAPYLVLPEDVFYMGIGTVAPGATGTYTLTVRNDGTAPLTIYDAWTTNPAFVVVPEQLRVEPGGEEAISIFYSASGTAEEHAIVHLLSDDPNQPLRDGYVVGNAEGIGVGDPFPYTEGTDVNSLASWSSDALAGKVGLVAYFATF